MPDAPARYLVETVAARYAEFLECAAARDLKAPLCMDDGMCSCRRDVAFIARAILDAIAELNETLRLSEEAMEKAMEILLKAASVHRAMIAELRKGIDNA